MANCTGLTQGAEYNCLTPIVPGVDERLLLGNKDDIDTLTFDLTDTNKITGISLKSGGKAMYAFQGFNNSLQEDWTIRKSPSYVGYQHGPIDFSIFDIDYEALENVKAMAVTKLFAIVEGSNFDGNGDGIFRVYGLGSGLEVVELSGSRTNPDNGGAIRAQIRTSDESPAEVFPPLLFWDTDYSTSKTAIDALLTPTV
jgi:hypothetical protein